MNMYLIFSAFTSTQTSLPAPNRAYGSFFLHDNNGSKITPRFDDRYKHTCEGGEKREAIAHTER
jgi:hypothetical protein